MLANITLEPVRALVLRLSALAAAPVRLVVSGILAGEQELEAVLTASEAGLVPVRRVYEAEWVSMDLRPAGGPSAGRASSS